MRPRTARKAVLGVLLCLLAVLAAGCGSEGDTTVGGSPSSPAKLPASAPPPLARIRDQASELLSGGTDAFDQRLAELKGIPVVVNKWASWCGPCRAEFPFFQSQANKLGGRVAFLGVDFFDSNDAAQTFLDENPLPYPSYTDPDKEIASALDVEFETPSTVFYDSNGDLVHTYRGAYASEADLAADIKRYAR